LGFELLTIMATMAERIRIDTGSEAKKKTLLRGCGRALHETTQAAWSR
jgi:hypothetical protein